MFHLMGRHGHVHKAKKSVVDRVHVVLKHFSLWPSWNPGSRFVSSAAFCFVVCFATLVASFFPHSSHTDIIIGTIDIPKHACRTNQS
ncbi:hypothetical protein L228DRAFT_38475 [Xylona heveae TC161]|uniref:Uncharacterized protein n=1 Tax=Xylona heveae (strain CBS 132557 / TC161) TaxID=1328760 RepID=A0A164ZXV0_XYLHT|nr:hypothetical protein L228DRAFT_38475 [Xylona heveae TC161]KZF19676.1 hypothetical protein L228DRAFT_38475 [Xylona heveae TC161]